jgi:phosphopantothenoylcysteine decarboxylase/phosphopantothenate--cysteine ligase
MHGTNALMPRTAAERFEFGSFADLDEKLRSELSHENYAAVIHCAAVGDYSVVDAKPDQKLSSDQDLTLHLKANFKILPRLREYSRNKRILVIGFKLTLNQNKEKTRAAGAQILHSEVDAIVANDWTKIEADRSKHPGTLVTRFGHSEFSTVDELIRRLQGLLLKGGRNDLMS